MMSLGIPRESRDLSVVESQLHAQLSLFKEAKVNFDNDVDSCMHSSLIFSKTTRQTWQKH